MNIEYIALIGAGNVAWHLAPALEAAGYVVTEVYSRQFEHAKKLAKRLYNGKAHPTLDFSDSRADLFILTVPDLYIGSVAHSLTLPDGAILVHTSGSQPLATLAGAADYTGIFYPLQTFTKEKKVKFDKIALFIEADNQQVTDALSKIAYSLSKKVFQLSSDERKALHIAAVFACNFANHCLMLSSELMDKIGLDFTLMQPLIEETFQKALELGPVKAQTGPAARNDKNTLIEHYQLLKTTHPTFQEAYQVLTESIRNSYGHQPPLSSFFKVSAPEPPSTPTETEAPAETP